MRRRTLAAAALAGPLFLFGCVTGFPSATPGGSSFRITSLESSGDPARRASNQLLVQGLGRDAEARPSEALGLYERALQVDPTNPYAYLVLARHHAEGVEPERAFSFLDRASALFDQEPERPPGVDAHLVGLRGAALRGSGRVDPAAVLLARARSLDPLAWDDGHLSARELR